MASKCNIVSHITNMTLKSRIPVKTLAVYPHLHRNSQCGSCSTVMPGDICFNCGRLSTLLVTPRPAQKQSKSIAAAATNPAPAKSKATLHSEPFGSQYDRIDKLLSEQEGLKPPYTRERTFDSQLTQVENLLDAKRELTDAHTLTANDVAPSDNSHSNSFSQRLSYSPRATSTSSRTHAICPSVSASRTQRSNSSAWSDVLDEDGRPHAHVVAQWFDSMKPSGRCAATLTRRGMDCRLNRGGKVLEWTVFL